MEVGNLPGRKRVAVALAVEGTGFDTEGQADQNMVDYMAVGKVLRAARHALEETTRSPRQAERHMWFVEGRKGSHSIGYFVSR